MEELLKMRKIEQDYKNYYMESGLRTEEQAISITELRKIFAEGNARYRHLFREDFFGSLMEDAFFPKKQDISVIQHFRYMPATFHQHDFFELACVLSGSFINFIENQKIRLYPGDIFILSPHTRHAVCAYQDDAVMVNILIRSSTFEQHFLKILPDNGLLYDFFVRTLYDSPNAPYLLFKTGKDSALSSYILQIIREFQRNRRYKSTMLSSLLAIFFVTLLRNHEKDVVVPSIKPAVMSENVIFILQYMQKHFTTITLSHLAEFFNYSDRQMQRIIKTVTGLSFSENIKKMRMNYAAELLSKTHLTVQEIAEMSGYCDVRSFRQLFKSFYGRTPQQYREQEKSAL